MAKRKKYPKLPNGYGSIKRLSGKNRTNPYGVYPPTREFNPDGTPVPQRAICYVDDWYKGFTVLTWYKNGEYYEGREKELSSDSEELKKQIIGILSKYNQSQREAAGQKTFSDVFKEFYLWKYKEEYKEERKKRKASETSSRTAYKNCSSIHDVPFRSLTTADLQKVIDDCPLRHASLELIVSLFKQMYAYADANDLCDKKYSDYVTIGIADDDEHGVPFSDDELKILWNNKENDIVELLLIMCYSGFRISEYIDMEVNLKEKYFKGGIKTDAGKNRVVPIHSAILPLVSARIKRQKAMLTVTPSTFRKFLYPVLEEIGVSKHTPHDCRHTFNAMCDRYGVEERDKKLMLGHAFQDVTNKVYLHRSIEDLRSQIEKIKVCH